MNTEVRNYCKNKSNLDTQVLKDTFLAFLVLLSVLLLTFFRNPRLFIYPEPWQEDMAIFISQEYSIGFPETAFTLYAGYIHLLPRIIVWAAMKLGMTGVMPAMTWTVLFFQPADRLPYIQIKGDKLRPGQACSHSLPGPDAFSRGHIQQRNRFAMEPDTAHGHNHHQA